MKRAILEFMLKTFFFSSLILFYGCTKVPKAAAVAKRNWDAHLMGTYKKSFSLEDSLILAKDFSIAFNSLGIKAKEFIRQEDWKGWFYTQNKMAFVLHRLRKFNDSQTILDSARTFFLKKDSSLFLLAQNYLLTAQTLSFRQKASNALHTLKLASLLFSSNSDTLNLARCIRVEGDIQNFNLNNTKRAKEGYEASILLLEKIKPQNLDELCLAYYGLSSCLSKRGDFEMAKFYVQKGIGILEHHPSFQISKSSFIESLAAIDYRAQDFGQAIESYQKVITATDAPGSSKAYKASVYRNLAGCYIEVNNFKHAFTAYQSAIHLLDAGQPDLLVKCYLGLGTLYQNKGNTDSSEYYFRKALGIERGIFAKNDYNTATTYQSIGSMYKSDGQLDSALTYFQQAIISQVDSFSSKDILQSPKIKLEDLRYGLLTTLTDKAQTLLLKYYETNDTRFAKASFEINAQSNILAFQQLQQLVGNDSHLLLNSHLQNHLKGSLFSCHILSLYEKPDQYVEEAFKIMELSKASLMLKSIAMAHARSLVDEQDSLISRLNKVKDSIMVYGNSKQESHNQSKLEKFKVDEMMAENVIRDQYPALYQAKYSTGAVSIPNMQAFLKKKEAILIEYSFVDSALFYCMISPDTAVFTLVGNDTEWTSQINAVVEMVRNPAMRDFNRYQSVSYGLYKKILQPVLENSYLTGVKKIIVIPDGPLINLPFEALSTDSLGNGFRDLNYLIKKYSISYGFSATSFLVSRSENPNRISGILGFADNYSLKGSYDEIKQIEASNEGKFLLNEGATEENFKKFAGQYEILHLGIHGEANPENATAPYLKFSAKDSLNDGLLFDYEIAGSKISASMAVLPACETGFGEYKKGEGVLSIARAFAFSGCPVVISSLWKVNDRTTSKIIIDFYDGLGNNHEPQIALHNSKLNYLEQADEFLAHPTYWAGMIVIGQSDSIQNKNWKMVIFSLVGLGAIIIFFISRFSIASK